MCLYNYYIAYVREGTILKVGIISEQQKTLVSMYVHQSRQDDFRRL